MRMDHCCSMGWERIETKFSSITDSAAAFRYNHHAFKFLAGHMVRAIIVVADIDDCYSQMWSASRRTAQCICRKQRCGTRAVATKPRNPTVQLLRNRSVYKTSRVINRKIMNTAERRRRLIYYGHYITYHICQKSARSTVPRSSLNASPPRRS
ncbi:hypothetical protein NEOLEDRAFT_384174 [Neolentinus lepideus HHB14362 ss-1]|uniref:Uncharacterized protein n=1 Tax=Neolentinus lepideus HHB14362 ss-1 TaxID=1314782 RepID=A0A165SE09_9AGAM|nr:hypothetical protein NEOLEDRAFT_384174 [Neolentinus lepideus HHB14362 ss-1]